MQSTSCEKVDIDGLSSEEVRKQLERGNVNKDAGLKTRSISDIFRDNICTLFNLINLILALFVFFTGSYQNMLFMLVIVINVAIGIVQEIRSKITTDRLAIVAASHVTVVRNKELRDISVDSLVLGDVMRLGRGDQIPADARVLQGSCSVNESLLTGESKLITKEPGSELMSGSFVNSGLVWAQVEHVGSENYAAKISNEAKKHKAVNSEIMTSLNTIIKYISIFMFPVGALLFSSSYFLLDIELNSAILSSVSALVGMIPEGLILLTSTVLAVAVIRLARHKVLVQQLYCIETLARVDVLCLDKTGTITTGSMEVFDVLCLPGVEKSQAYCGFASLAAADADPNETSMALRRYFGLEGETSENKLAKANLLQALRVIPFSSEKKWSGASFADGTNLVMGACAFVLKNNPEALEQVQALSSKVPSDTRILLLARVQAFSEAGEIQGDPLPLACLCIRDEVRPSAPSTIAYFKEQGVELKVISGDDPRTVSSIAQKVGVPHAENYVDASELSSEEEIEQAIKEASVFGRVKPEQKKAFVLALQKQGHTVAMTGDGVNDVLALKASDCSVAMASGSDAARNVAQLVLVDNDFASMPQVVAEGRRSINNLQRSASLFLVKTLLSISSALLFIFLPWQYPFVPIQMTLISAFTIGLPSFVLALEPNKDLVRGRFLSNCVVHSIPGAICAVLSILLINLISYEVLGLDYKQVSTLCVLVVAFLGILLVVRLSIPFTPLRWALLIVVVGGSLLGVTLFGSLFNIAPFEWSMGILLACLLLIDLFAFNALYSMFDKRYQERILASSHPSQQKS